MLPNLAVFGLLALGLIAALTLFITLKYEVRVTARKQHARYQAMLERLEAAERPAPSPAPEPVPEATPLRSGLNLNKRVQAIRLLRRGEDLSHVAAALGVPRREIELLVRVQKLSAQRTAKALAEAAGAGR